MKITDIKVKESMYIAIFIVSGSTSMEKIFPHERPILQKLIPRKKIRINFREKEFNPFGEN